MKKNQLFILLGLLLCSVVGVQAQAPTTNAESPDLTAMYPYLPLYTNGSGSLSYNTTNNTTATYSAVSVGDGTAIKVTFDGSTNYNSYVDFVISPQLSSTDYAKYDRIRCDIYVSTMPTGTENFGSIRFYGPSSEGKTTSNGATMSFTPTNTNAGEWKTIDIALPTMTYLPLTNMRFVSGVLGNASEFYVNNIYLYKKVIPAPTTLLEPQHSAQDGYFHSFFSDVTNGNQVASTTGYLSLYTGAASKTAYKLDWSAGYSQYSGESKLIMNSSTGSVSAADLKKYTHLYIDVWSNTSLAEGNLLLYATNSSDTHLFSYRMPAHSGSSEGDNSGWKRYALSLSDDLGVSGSNEIDFERIRFLTGTGTGTVIPAETYIYVDNIYLYKRILYSPNVAPEEPTQVADNVIPIYGKYSTDEGLNSTVSAWLGTSVFSYTDEIKKTAEESMKITSSPSTITMNTTPLTLTSGKANVFRFDVWVDPTSTNPTLKVSLNEGTDYTIPSDLLNPSGWTTIELPISSIMGKDTYTNTSDISSIKFTSTGTMYMDNVFLYYGIINLNPVAELDGDQYYSIKAAVDAARNQTGNLEIAIIDDSMEPNAIYIDSKEDVAWESLTIYPKGNVGETRKVEHVGTTSDTWRSLFMFDNTAANVTINGRLNKTGASQSLILQGEDLGHSSRSGEESSRKFNFIINVRYASSVTISDCKFQGKSLTNRAAGAIQSNANNITITGNHFEDCLYPGKTASDDWGDASVVSIDGNTTGNSVNIVNVSGNSFYETADVNYTAVINYRSFIKVRVKSTNQTTPIKITNNKIGGRAANLGGGNMKIGYGSEAKQGSLYGIWFQSGYAVGSITDVDNTSAYALIYNNEIANIDIKNNGAGLVEENGTEVSDQIGSFVGINTQDGLCLVKENKIHDVSIASQAYNGGSQRFLSMGIYSFIYGGRNRIIIENNDVYNLKAAFLNDAPNKSVLIGGIFAQMSNNSSGTGTAVGGSVRNNRVLFGHSDNHEMNSYSDIFGISARLSTVDSPDINSAQMNVYNNVVVCNEFALTKSQLRGTSAINLVNSAQTDKGVINCYNNITYIQAKESGSFVSGVTTPISGINHTVNQANGLVNVFHNTVLLAKDTNLATSAALSHDYRFASTDGASGYGTLAVWNNNFVNLNDNGLIYYIAASTTYPKAVSFDYNNYYVPTEGYMAGANENFVNHSASTIKTFDNWKFSNLLSYLDKKTEHDHHSRFLDPYFGGLATGSGTTVDATSISAIDELKTKLVPKLFLGGKESNVSELKVLTTSVNSSNVATVSTAAMANGSSSTDTNNNNTDISSNKRRPKMPTMGALNTSFGNYWNGTAFAEGTTPSSTETNPWNRDFVFAEGLTTASNYTVGSAMSVHDIYNDTQANLVIGAVTLTVTGYVEMKGAGKVDATNNTATVVYAGADGHALTDKRKGAAAQHIFEGTFANNRVNNIYLNNGSQYFVLLHGKRPWIEGEEPNENSDSSSTLVIYNDFGIMNPTDESINYPGSLSYLPKGKHPGALNCMWYKTTLYFFNTSNRTPDLSKTASYSESTPYTYRPYSGQRIPRHGIFNDEVYNLTSNSTKTVTYHDKLYVRHNLRINENRKFEVAADKYVQVEGLTTNSAGASGLVIKSRELNEDPYKVGANGSDAGYLFAQVPRPNATFIFNPGKNNSNVPASVEMYSPANNGASGSGPNGEFYSYRWQYFTPAVQSAPLNSFTGHTWDLAEWNAPGNIYDPNVGSPYWKWVNGNLSGWTGYCVTQKSPVVYTTTGTLTNSSKEIAMTYYKYPKAYVDEEAWKLGWFWEDQEANDGQYVIGNAYTAAIDITKISFGTGLEQTVYIFNTGSNADWTSLGTSSDNPGGYLVIPQNLAGESLPQYIPSMQGFTVRFAPNESLVDKTTTSSLTINYNYTSGSETIGKNDAVQRSSGYTAPMSYMYVSLKNGDFSDRLMLVTHPDCKKGFDNGWDGYKWVGEEMPAQLFTIEEQEDITAENTYFQVSTMDDIDETWLGFLLGESKTEEYELVFNYTDMDGIYDSIYLEDMLTGEKTDISAEGSVYRFRDVEAGKITKRFRITTSLDSGVFIDQIEEPVLKVYNIGKTLVIENSESQEGMVYLYDLAGKCLLAHKVNGQSKTEIETNLDAGVYLIKTQAGITRINKTILLK